VEQRKVLVQDLSMGMYVVALDRPWLQSPFLFQGFLIQTDEELAQLQACCRYVFVDVELSRSDVEITGQRSNLPLIGAAQHSLRALRIATGKASDDRQAMHDYLGHVFCDLRLGKSLSTADAKTIVTSMVDNICTAPKAALWLTKLKNKDEYTTIHSMNVCVLTLAFCQHMNFSRPEMEVIGLGALLHDIGKTRTPLHILNKPGALTREEFAVMQRHPEDGYRIMQRAGGVPRESLAIIRLHHERLSGDGYPLAMAGTAIGMPILMTAIADVYDALTSDRIYHAGLTSDEALRVMYKHADRTFGQELLQEFIRCIGIYPVGSFVQLHNSSVGLVIASTPDTRLTPTILMISGPAGEQYTMRRVVDLAAIGEPLVRSGWSIQRLLNEREVKIDPVGLVFDRNAAAFNDPIP